jgi:branched-subunit amino acid transport protein AzlD
MSFSSVDSLVLLPGYICNFLTLHCTVFTCFPKAFPSFAAVKPHRVKTFGDDLGIWLILFVVCTCFRSVKYDSDHVMKKTTFFHVIPHRLRLRRGIFLLKRPMISPINEIVSIDERPVTNEHAGKNPVPTGTP